MILEQESTEVSLSGRLHLSSVRNQEKKSLFNVNTHTLDQTIVAVMEGYHLKGILTQSLTLDFIMRHVRKRKLFRDVLE